VLAGKGNMGDRERGFRRFGERLLDRKYHVTQFRKAFHALVMVLLPASVTCFEKGYVHFSGSQFVNIQTEGLRIPKIMVIIA